MTITLHGTNGVTTAGITLGSTAIASTGAELNILDGVTSTAAELNILDGVTSTTAELNILDGVTSTTAEINILDGVTSTAAELNILDGVTTTAAEINLIDGGTSRGTTALADGDGILINDAGTMRMSTVQTVKTYMTAGVGASTTLDAVGTYTLANDGSSTTKNQVYKSGRTTAGSNLTSMAYTGGTRGVNRIATSTSYTTKPANSGAYDQARSGTSYVTDNASWSGSWRSMSAGGTSGETSAAAWDFMFGSLWLRYQ